MCAAYDECFTFVLNREANTENTVTFLRTCALNRYSHGRFYLLVEGGLGGLQWANGRLSRKTSTVVILAAVGAKTLELPDEKRSWG